MTLRNDQAAQAVQVKVQPKDSREALWPDLIPGDTVFGDLVGVGVLQEATVKGKTAVTLRVLAENGKTVVVTLPAEHFISAIRQVASGMARFGEPAEL